MENGVHFWVPPTSKQKRYNLVWNWYSIRLLESENLAKCCQLFTTLWIAICHQSPLSIIVRCISAQLLLVIVRYDFRLFYLFLPFNWHMVGQHSLKQLFIDVHFTKKNGAVSFFSFFIVFDWKRWVPSPITFLATHTQPWSFNHTRWFFTI